MSEKFAARAFSCCCFLSAIAITMSISIKYMGLSSRAATLNDGLDPVPVVLPYDTCGGIFADATESTKWT